MIEVPYLMILGVIALVGVLLVMVYFMCKGKCLEKVYDCEGVPEIYDPYDDTVLKNPKVEISVKLTDDIEIILYVNDVNEENVKKEGLKLQDFRKDRWYYIHMTRVKYNGRQFSTFVDGPCLISDMEAGK